MYPRGFIDFVEESNRIEGIKREPTQGELEATHSFMMLEEVTVDDLRNLVSILEPGAVIRDQVGMDVRVGGYFAPKGGTLIPVQLEELLNAQLSPYEQHIAYEQLHPFTDGNGRSGRALWLQRMGLQGLVLGFLHIFYYQTLQQLSVGQIARAAGLETMDLWRGEGPPK